MRINLQEDNDTDLSVRLHSELALCNAHIAKSHCMAAGMKDILVLFLGMKVDAIHISEFSPDHESSQSFRIHLNPDSPLVFDLTIWQIRQND